MSSNRHVIIIGSGPSGAMAAHELIQQGIPVIMLESGHGQPKGLLIRLKGQNVFRWKPYDTVANAQQHVASGDPATEWAYNLALGGFSGQWTGAVPRFAPEDFYEGAQLSEAYRWPITYEELEPFYEKAEEQLIVTAGSQSFPQLPASKAAYRRDLPKDWQHLAQHAAKWGQGLTMLPLADGPPWMVVRRGTAFNSYYRIVSKLLKSPHFQLISGAHVLKLNWSAQKNRVDSVIYQDRTNGSQHQLAGTAVMVAAGPINSARLLFNSACSDFPEGLGNSAGILGRYLHDHPREWWIIELDKPITRISSGAYLTRRPYADSAPLIASSWTLGVASHRDKYLQFIQPKGNQIGVQVFGTMIPRTDYFIKPDEQKKDKFGFPAANICLSYEEPVVQNMIAARNQLINIFEDAGYQGQIEQMEPQLAPGSSVHYGGAVRMHDSPKYGVLDRWNRLHDIPNVSVVDASCFTTGAEKNPTPTIMAIAARAAAKLANDLKTANLQKQSRQLQVSI